LRQRKPRKQNFGKGQNSVANQEEDRVSADLAGFTDPETDERERWARLDREALLLCDPLARMLGHKKMCSALDVSKGQLSRELSEHYETNLSLRTALYLGRETQNERLATIIVCDGLGMRLPEWQKKKVTDADWRRAFIEACGAAGVAGSAILDEATRRAKAAR
jgi:hypothetical protein